MDTKYYLDKFQESADHSDKELFAKNDLAIKVGVWLNSVVLKIQKNTWVNQSPAAKPFEESIFFSVWINDESIKENKLNYNIHALKLRQLAGYTIQSREFAAAFRVRFKAFENKWPNVNLNFGPLTLMEGWVKINDKAFENVIQKLVSQFLEIQPIIDDLLAERKK